MGARLVEHVKVLDEAGNIMEITIWELPKPQKGKTHGYKYSLAYIVEGVRVVGYDNAEGKGDHRHYGSVQETYSFQGIDKLFDDFYKDVRRFRK